jgi:hypothetical protein
MSFLKINFHGRMTFKKIIIIKLMSFLKINFHGRMAFKKLILIKLMSFLKLIFTVGCHFFRVQKQWSIFVDESYRSQSGLPDFSWYMKPKPKKCTK